MLLTKTLRNMFYNSNKRFFARKIKLDIDLKKEKDDIIADDKNEPELMEDGSYHYNKGIDDETYLFRFGIQVPLPEPGARYYCMEYKGKIYHFFNAENYSYGRMCVKIATLIRGKHKPNFTPHSE